MKKQLFIAGAIACFALFMTGCAITRSPQSSQTSKFTSAENIISLKLGTSYNDVVTHLGIPPYDILSNQVDGYAIYVYHYKTVERVISPEVINQRGGETAGTEVYNRATQAAFLFFKNDKLETLITSKGRKESHPLVLLNNTLHVITKDKDKYVITPATEESNNESLFRKRNR